MAVKPRPRSALFLFDPGPDFPLNCWFNGAIGRSLWHVGATEERFRACGRGQVRSRTGGFSTALGLLECTFWRMRISKQEGFAPAGATRAFRSPWTFGSILFWRLGEIRRRRTLPDPSLPREGWYRLVSGFTDFIRICSRETNHGLLFKRMDSNSSRNRSSCPRAFSPPSVGRGGGGFSCRIISQSLHRG